MSSSINFNSINYHEVLGVGSGASKKDLKKAYQGLIKVYHPDRAPEGEKEKYGEITKKITHAYRVLTDQVYKDSCKPEELGIYKYMAKAPLDRDQDLIFESEKFKAKLDKWERHGKPLSERIIFKRPDYSSACQVQPVAPLDKARQAYRQLLNTEVTSAEELLNGICHYVLNERLIEISSALKSFLTSNKIYEPLAFSSSQQLLLDLHHKPDFTQDLALARKIYSVFSADISLYTREEIKEIEDFIQEIKEKCFYTVEEKLFRTIKGLWNEKSRLPNRVFGLTPLGLQEVKQKGFQLLGTVPSLSIKLLPRKDQNATCCKICKKAFGLFTHMKHCTKCGKACCSDCLKFQKFPEYTKPIRVCVSHGPQDYKEDWKKKIDDKKSLEYIKRKYLLLMDLAGYATQEDFKRWMETFVEANRYDLAFLCCDSAGGDWLELAQKLIEKKCYKEALSCIDAMKKDSWQNKTWAELTEKERQNSQIIELRDGTYLVKSYKRSELTEQDFLELGEKYANNIPLALLFFKKAGYSLEKMLESSMQYFFQPFGKPLLLMLLQRGNYQQQIQHTITSILRKDNLSSPEYAAVAFCFSLQNFSLEQWISQLNLMPLQHVEPMLKYLHRYKKCDLSEITLNADRDYIRWFFIHDKQLDSALNHLIKSLETGNESGVPYFLTLVAGQDLIAKRDEYIAKKDYLKAFVCHRLKAQSLSWAELAKKWERTYPLASIVCLSLETRDICTIGHTLFDRGNYLGALQCYLYRNNYETIQKQLPHIKGAADKLPYQVALWRYHYRPSLFGDICDSLFELKDHQTAQKLLIAQLKETDQSQIPLFHQYLTQTNLTSHQFLGLLETAAPLCQDKITKLWLQAQLKELEEGLEKRILKAFACENFADLLEISDLMTPLSWEYMKNIFSRLDESKMFGSYKSAALFMSSLHYLFNPRGPQTWEAMYALSAAMLNFANESVMPFYAQVLEKINALPPSSLKFEGEALTELNFTNISYFSEKLTGSSVIKLLKLANASLTKVEPFKAAMCYLDLQLTPLGSEGTIGSCLAAAFELTKVMQTLQERDRIYAFKRGILQLTTTAFVLANRGLCPSSQLYVYRALISLLTAAYEKSQRVGPKDLEILKAIRKEFKRVSTHIPLTLSKTLSLFDTIYVHFTYQQLNETYLKMMRNRPSELNNPKWQSLIFSGVWEGWIEENFDAERERTMRKLLAIKGSSMEEVENVMKWPALLRDPDGWLPPEPVPLNLAETKFSQVQSVTFDLETGAVNFSFATSSDPMESLFDMNDVRDVLKLGIGSAYVSFEEADSNFPNQPIQAVDYAPANMVSTGFWGTLVHADYLLKKFSMGTEVSAEPPFAQRSISEGLLHVVPIDLREKYMEVFADDVNVLAERVHRFWIEAISIDYARYEDGNKITYEIGSCTMKVQKHLMKRDENGKLIDTQTDKDTTSTEAKFAKFMTEEYDRLGKYFPIFARLKELAKLQAISRFVADINASMIYNSENVNISPDKIKEVLKFYSDQVTYPINVEQEIRDYRAKHYVPYHQENELRQAISRQCADADASCVAQLTKFLQEQFNVSNNLEYSVKNWLMHGPSNEFIALLRSSKEAYEKQRLLVICNAFKRAGIAVEPDVSKDKKQIWIPSAFKKESFRRVYGGVAMQANLNRVSNLNGGSGGSLPPGGNSNGALVNRPRYIVSLDSWGRITGTMTGVDRVTGNTYQIVDHESCIRDQFNARNMKPDTVAFWKTHVGYTETEHYTAHTNQYRHDHKTNGWTDCYDPNGNKVDSYRSGSKGHRCQK